MTVMVSNSSINYSTSDEEDKVIPVKQDKGSSPIGSVFIIVNAALGAGLLSFPQAFVFAGGVIRGLVLEVCLAILMAINLVVIAYATELSRANSYQQMIKRLFGSIAATIVQICIILYTFGSCVTYTVIIGDQVEKLFELLPNQLYLQWYFDRRIWTSAIAIIFIFPLCLFRNIRFLNWPSLAGVCSCLYISIMTFTVYFIRDSQNRTATQFDVSDDPSWSAFKFFSALPIFCFGYQCHLATVPVYAGLKKKSVPKFVFIAIAAILICFWVYTLTGVFGFLTFGVTVDPDVIKSYDAHNTLVIIARIGLLVSMITSYPLLAFLGRSPTDEFVVQTIRLLSIKWSNLTILTVDTGKTQLFRLQLISLCWFAISLLLGVFLPSIEVVITPIGGVAAMFSIVYPGFLIVSYAVGARSRSSLWKQILYIGFGGVVVYVGSFIGGYSATQGVINLVVPRNI
ncbi:Sodium-coupled neutral amino acid transporter 7 [Oopsacas minuta]|uniref:Sodium-coupled neutral amino acid transporter 7 n=1 Tax=Oopsacas minuta TaxID=111878 RepID=A0AAV7JAM5_9METZ|nr:Sodium-coupled neutral amino acid transporter 7 [Oopsacas minuta]